ncbi:3-hydroxybutyryl-CoA dehydratase-like protein, mitochondrial [Cladophialophora carrionii]|uniref:3-hydroxybutyryl-CoA dehydratase-like protein, mitochondrial n=1 Tax=Cladophialophora carrionii TaxID=86049 RepID=A0A1C1CXL3_9EURO|nr:3-hydroxybutyryl-CoA dehydratase-like protein, mitochondrial [Cladophialophora carrionii]
MSSQSFSSILYGVSADHKVATITLNRPQHFNAIDSKLPSEIRAAVRLANADAKVHCIVIKGNGPGFCGGYDLNLTAEQAVRGTTEGSQDVSKGYDPLVDYQMMKEYTECYAELFRSHKPTIAQVHGAAVAGGSDIALSCDLVVMAEDARIGYTPTRVWGCPTTAMWTYRLGPEKAKRMLFTGDLVSGKEAESMGLVLKAVPANQLDHTVQLLADRIKTVPVNQLWMQKRVVNSIIEGSVERSQQLATIFDGLTRNSPEGIAFQQMAAKEGFKRAIAHRDNPGRTPEYRKIWKSSL